MRIDLVERPLDEFRHAKGRKKTRIWKQQKEAIIAQGLDSEARRRDRDEYLNRKR